MLTLEQFISAHYGQPLEIEDSSNLDQCVDLALGWCDNLAIPRAAIRHLSAYQIFTVPNALTFQYFDLIPYPTKSLPPAGALMVFGAGLGAAGHVSIAARNIGPTQFDSFDQNWDTANYHDDKGNPICRIVRHNYNYVLGWLVPKQLNQGGVITMTPEVAAVLEDLKQNIIAAQKQNQNLQAQINGLSVAIFGKDDINIPITSRIEDVKGHVINVENKVNGK